jgi:bud emergence protein 1
MEDRRSWSLCRFYEDFYDFQIALLDEFKEEAGHTGQNRILPYMPGPVTYVTDTISAARRQSLDEYIKKLLSMPSYISKCRLVKLLFAPRPGDVETTHYRNSQQPAPENRQSTLSQQSSDSSREPSRQSSAQNLNGTGSSGYPGLSAPPPRNSGGQQRMQPPRMLRQDSSMSAATAGSGTGQFLKVKIEYHDEMVAVRLPKDANFAQLQEKLYERLGNGNVNTIQYKDEASGQILDLYHDNDLNTALNRNPKLKLIVN